MEPNTKIHVGKLKESDLEKMIEAYRETGLSVYHKETPVSIDSINDSNKELREFEITPNPFGKADNKLIIGVKYCTDGNLYIHTKIHPGENSIKNPKELQDLYDRTIRTYYLK